MVKQERIRPSIQEMTEKARLIRRDILEMMWLTGSGHIGGSLSMVEIGLVLYHRIMNVDPKHPDSEDRDRFVLSKGHAAACQYAILADLGFFDCELLWTEFIRTKGRLSEHPELGEVPGIDMSTGPLGQGISSAVGMAWASRYLGGSHGIYVVCGCGEHQEGQVWEAAMSAGHLQLDNLVVILDYNGMQVSGATCDVVDPEPIIDKYRAFNWDVTKIENGNDVASLTQALETSKPAGKPRIMVAYTIKGKGVSFMENNASFHSTTLTEQQYKQAAQELGPLRQKVMV